MKTKIILFGVLFSMISFQAVSAQNHYVNYYNDGYTGNSVDYYYLFQEKINNAYMNYQLDYRDRVLLINDLKSLRRLERRYSRDGYLSQSEFYQLRDRSNRIENKFYYLIQRSFQAQYYGNYYPYNSYNNGYYYGNHNHNDNGNHYGWNNNQGNHYGWYNGHYHRNGNPKANNKAGGQNKNTDKPLQIKEDSNKSLEGKPSVNQRDLDDYLTMKNTKTRELKEENIQWENLN